jgi:hypothetical protein
MQKKKNLLVLDVYQERKIPKISFCFMISSFWDSRVGAGRQAGRQREDSCRLLFPIHFEQE